MNTQSPLVEAIKEVLRYAVFLVAGIIINAALVYLANFTAIESSISPEIQVFVVGLLTGILRAIDKYVHDNSKLSWNGIVPF
jgi:hypothetical protein